MLTENEDIDKLFFQKLGNYEKTPPPSVWSEIEESLNAMDRRRQFKKFKTIGIAAATILGILSVWGIINYSYRPDFRPPMIAKNTAPAMLKDYAVTASKPAISENKTSNHSLNTSYSTVKTNNVNHSNISSLAAFAANTTFIGTKGGISISKSGDSVLIDPQNSVDQHLMQAEKLAEKVANWIEASSVRENDETKDTIKVIHNQGKSWLGQNSRGNSDTFNSNLQPKKRKNVWSLKAEYNRVIRSQSQNYGMIGSTAALGFQYYPATKSIASNEFSAGVVAGYKLSKKVVVKSGIEYNSISESIKDIDITLINYPGKKGSNQTNETSFKRTFEFVEIPLRATYLIHDNGFLMGISGGVSGKFLTGNKAGLYVGKEQVVSGQTPDISNIVYSGMLGLELGYEISNRFSISVEPRFKHYISTLSTNKSANPNTNQFEISTGLTYSFN